MVLKLNYGAGSGSAYYAPPPPTPPPCVAMTADAAATQQQQQKYVTGEVISGTTPTGSLHQNMNYTATATTSTGRGDYFRSASSSGLVGRSASSLGRPAAVTITTVEYEGPPPSAPPARQFVTSPSVERPRWNQPPPPNYSRDIDSDDDEEYNGNSNEDDDPLPPPPLDDRYSTAPLVPAAAAPPFPSEDAPVVPVSLIQPDAPTPQVEWSVHPNSVFITSLLHKRGIALPHNRNMIEYHMADVFLASISVLRTGSYFVRYKQRNSPPKERYFKLVMVDDGSGTGTEIPFLMWFLHQHGMQVVDKVPLTHLVGVVIGTKCPAFRRHMVSGNTIIGCYAGAHRPKLPTNGAFSLWFWDPAAQRPRSVDLLTTNMTTFQIWTTTFKAFLSVNSVSITGKRRDMASRLEKAQRAMAESMDAK